MREALIALEVEGLVEVRIGSGIYVRAPVEGAGGDSRRGGGRTVRVAARALCDRIANARRSRRSRRSTRRCRRSRLRWTRWIGRWTRDSSRSPGDRLFHLRIAEATGNGALVHVIKLLWDERSGPLYKQLEHHYDSPELWRAAMSEHRAVLKSIARARSAVLRAPRCSAT